MSTVKKQPETQPDEVQVRVKWGSPEGLETIYVNHLFVTHAGSEFYLIFGELTPPHIAEGERFPKELIITPRVRLSITPDAMKAISVVIQDNLGNYLSKKGDSL